MATDTYATIERKLTTLEPFDNKNSMSARWENDVYVVYSYRTVIAHVNGQGEGGRDRWVSPEKYSTTTSRQQNLIRRVWGL